MSKNDDDHLQQNGEVKTWRNFRDIADPETAAVAVIQLYGAASELAVSQCAEAAIADDRTDDHRFWMSVLPRVRQIRQQRREMALAYWESIGLTEI